MLSIFFLRMRLRKLGLVCVLRKRDISHRSRDTYIAFTTMIGEIINLHFDSVFFQGRHGSKGWQESSLKKTAERLSKSCEQQASLQGAEDALFLQTR